MLTEFQKSKLTALKNLGIVVAQEMFQGFLVVTTTEQPSSFAGPGVERFTGDRSQGFLIPAAPVFPPAHVALSAPSRKRGSLNDFI